MAGHLKNGTGTARWAKPVSCSWRAFAA